MAAGPPHYQVTDSARLLAPTPDNILEIFSIMQHHGAPTRLLDFTHSAYVACFFAVENEHLNNTGRS
jgi:hypothetical protein